MITIKNRVAFEKMTQAGQLLAQLFNELSVVIIAGKSTLDIEKIIAEYLNKHGLLSQSHGYRGYKHVSCISINDEVVHGIPSDATILTDGDLVKVDVCAAYKGYCADMARCFFVGKPHQEAVRLVRAAETALDYAIEKVQSGNRLSDISAAIQSHVESEGFGVVRDFAGHGIGKRMHEEPEIVNYGVPGKGPILRHGMSFAIEPMITLGDYEVYIADDGWTAKTKDKSLAAHVEDTVLVTDDGPRVITRLQT